MAALTTTFAYKTDPSAGDIPAIVHYKPADSNASTPRPVVIIFHAGGYVVGGTWMIPRPQIDALLDLGFVVVTPEYRLCPQVSVAEGPVTDAREALVWTRTQLPSLLKSTAGVDIDPKRIGAMGHSAGGNLALLLGGEAEPPSAILDIYALLYYDREFYHRPLAAFGAIPDTPRDFRDKVFEGPVPFTAPSMMTRDGKPDLSSPRNAWMIQTLKDGTQIAGVVKDGDYSKVDAVHQFKKGFPPTAILHGTKDIFAPYEYSVEASEALKGLGVTTELITVPEQSHMFDIAITKDHELFEYVQKGLEFLAKHV